LKDGFVIPEGNNFVDWIDQDTLFVGTDFGRERCLKRDFH